MNVTRPRDDEVYIRLAPSQPDPIQELRASSSRTQELTRSYDAFVYTNLQIPGLTLPGQAIPNQVDLRTMIPLRAVEKVIVRWGRYQDYLATFFVGTKEPDMMRDRLFETLSPGLQVLFSGQPLADRPVRVWWSCETPELEDLPWELIAYARRGGAADFSFVRGSPPSTPVPKVPLSGPLRLAFIHDPSLTPQWLRDALNSLPPGIQVIPMTTLPRHSLEVAARDGFELVHIVADGIVSLSYEGILYLHGTTSPELAAGELSTLLNGSRVSVLSLTEPDTSNSDMVQIGRYQVPSAYRAFAYLGRSTLPLPNIVAPLGPHDSWKMQVFWSNFYTRLNESQEVEKAMAEGRAATPDAVAMTLFLRQDQRRTFHRLEATQQAPAMDPTQVSADLVRSREMVSQLNSLQVRYGDLPESVKKFLVDESARQGMLEAELAPWLGAGEGEE